MKFTDHTAIRMDCLKAAIALAQAQGARTTDAKQILDLANKFYEFVKGKDE